MWVNAAEAATDPDFAIRRGVRRARNSSSSSFGGKAHHPSLPLFLSSAILLAFTFGARLGFVREPMHVYACLAGLGARGWLLIKCAGGVTSYPSYLLIRTRLLALKICSRLGNHTPHSTHARTGHSRHPGMKHKHLGLPWAAIVEPACFLRPCPACFLGSRFADTNISPRGSAVAQAHKPCTPTPSVTKPSPSRST